MKLLISALRGLLFVGLVSPAVADEYQDAISKAFPGFRILGPSDIALNKDLDPRIYNEVKDHPGFVLGRFDSDKVMDFAALIRGPRRKHLSENKAQGIHADDYYEGYVVVCLGRARGGYECTKMQTDALRLHGSYDGFLQKFSPGSEACSLLGKAFKAPKPKRDFNAREEQESNVEIGHDTDVFALFDQAYFIYVPQGRGMYRECYAGS